MSRAIWKVTIDPMVPSPQTVRMPFGAKPLHVDLDTRDESKIAVWFECNPDADQVGVPLWIVGTGHEIPGTTQHLGSVVHRPFAWHVYMGRK